MNELMTVEEAASKLKLAPKTMRDWLRTGKLPAVRLGKRWLIREQDLGAAVETHLRRGTNAQPREPGPRPSLAEAPPQGS
jgi:excisionase family DNA binding protein